MAVNRKSNLPSGNPLLFKYFLVIVILVNSSKTSYMFITHDEKV